MSKLWIAFLSIVLFAAGPPKQPKIVSINSANSVEMKSGEKGEYVLELVILKGFHIQANPASEKYLIPLTVKVDPAEGVQTGNPSYPEGKPFRLKGSDRDISTYEGTVRVKIPIRIETKIEQERTLKGSIRYQGCDDELCYPPVTMPLELKMHLN